MLFSGVIFHRKSIPAVVSDSEHCTKISSPGQAVMLLGVNTTDRLTELERQATLMPSRMMKLDGGQS